MDPTARNGTILKKPVPFHQAALCALALAPCLASAGCGGAARTAVMGPSMGIAAWRRVESPHFTLETDVDQGQAKEIAASLEKIYMVMHAVAFPLEKVPNLHTHAIVFREKGDYAFFGPKGSNGAFQAEGFGAFEEPTLMISAAISNSVQKMLVHELTHRFVNHVCPQAPRWLNEGLADYYQTIVVDNGEATLGKTDYVFTLGSEWNPYTGAIPVDALPSLEELDHMDAQTFYAARTAPEGSAGKDARRRQTANYASAWAAVHVLQNGSKERRDGLHRWISGMAAGNTAAAALRQALGNAAIADLEKERRALVEKVAGGHIRVLHEDCSEAKLPPFEERALRPAEVNLLWAKLQVGNGKEGEEGARLFVAEALKLEPTWTAARLLNASLLDGQRRYSDAEREVTAAAKAAPDDESAARALFHVRTMPWRYGGGTPEDRAKTEELLATWLPRAKDALTLNAFARYLTTQGRAEEAVSAATRAATLDPACVGCFDTLGGALFRTGQFAAALEAQERGVAILGERQGWIQTRERLDLYRKAATAIAGWKARAAASPAPAALPADVTVAVQLAQTFHLRACYEHGLVRDPKLLGSVVLRTTIGPEGKVTSVEPVDLEDFRKKNAPVPVLSPLPDPSVVRCLTEQMSLFRFPESGQGIRVVLPLTFKPQP